MTPEQIAELEALAAKATPGPWEVEKDPTQEGNHATLVCTSGKFGQMGTWLLVCFHNWKDASMGGRCIAWKEAKTNAALTVALRNNLPAIIAGLKAQQPENTCEMPEVAAMRYIEALRADYGSGVTICCDNEEAPYKHEQVAIDCSGQWTGWENRRFYGESVIQCLAKALIAMQESRDD